MKYSYLLLLLLLTSPLVSICQTPARFAAKVSMEMISGPIYYGLIKLLNFDTNIPKPTVYKKSIKSAAIKSVGALLCLLVAIDNAISAVENDEAMIESDLSLESITAIFGAVACVLTESAINDITAITTEN